MYNMIIQQKFSFDVEKLFKNCLKPCYNLQLLFYLKLHTFSGGTVSIRLKKVTTLKELKYI